MHHWSACTVPVIGLEIFISTGEKVCQLSSNTEMLLTVLYDQDSFVNCEFPHVSQKANKEYLYLMCSSPQISTWQDIRKVVIRKLVNSPQKSTSAPTSIFSCPCTVWFFLTPKMKLDLKGRRFDDGEIIKQGKKQKLVLISLTSTWGKGKPLE